MTSCCYTLPLGTRRNHWKIQVIKCSYVAVSEACAALPSHHLHQRKMSSPERSASPFPAIELGQQQFVFETFLLGNGTWGSTFKLQIGHVQ